MSASIHQGIEEVLMSRYLFIARYASEGAKGVLKSGGTDRRTTIDKMASDLGGHMESFDFAFGEDDVFTTVELPDNKAAAAVALAINATGMTTVRTVVLLSPEEIDAAAQQTINYRPPGDTS
jgi:uncharacterized protein with GYD domain